MHLVFLIHGLLGNPGHLDSMAESINGIANDKNKIVVHQARAMSAMGTLDGVRVNAHRLHAELLSVLREKQATKLSIVGYSMGGLAGRYLLGLLDESGVFNHVQPVLFATFATPHAGSRYPRAGIFASAFDFIGTRVIGQAGADLFGGSSLLVELSDPQKVYFRALQRFPHLCTFANATKDRTVNFWTAFITDIDPFVPRRELDLHLYENYPFLVNLNKTRRTSEGELPASRVVAQRNRPLVKKLRGKLLQFAVQGLLPVFLAVLVAVLGAVSTIAYFRRLLFRHQRTNGVAKWFLGDVDEALDRTLELTRMEGPSREVEVGDADRSPDVPQPVTKRNDFIASQKPNLDLSDEAKTNIEQLNRLPWHKYAVWLHSVNTHGEIVDRTHSSRDGKALMDFFAEHVLLPVSEPRARL